MKPVYRCGMIPENITITYLFKKDMKIPKSTFNVYIKFNLMGKRNSIEAGLKVFLFLFMWFDEGLTDLPLKT